MSPNKVRESNSSHVKYMQFFNHLIYYVYVCYVSYQIRTLSFDMNVHKNFFYRFILKIRIESRQIQINF